MEGEGSGEDDEDAFRTEDRGPASTVLMSMKNSGDGWPPRPSCITNQNITSSIAYLYRACGLALRTYLFVNFFFFVSFPLV